MGTCERYLVFISLGASNVGCTERLTLCMYSMSIAFRQVTSPNSHCLPCRPALPPATDEHTTENSKDRFMFTVVGCSVNLSEGFPLNTAVFQPGG